MKVNLLSVCGLVLLISFTITSSANLSGTIYIDAVNGHDLSSGKTEAEAWKSFNRVNASVLSAGTKILLKRGCEWNERLEIRGSGTSDNWIKVGAYGDAEDKPKISLTNDPDDIGVLICDLDKTSGTPKQQNISYIEITDLEISNTRMGIYYRSVTVTENTGFRVSNVTFNNINCDEVMTAINSTADYNAEIGRQLAAVKGNLETIDTDSGGGGNEYLFPTAIFVGGITFGPQTLNGNHTTVLKEWEVSDCEFNEAIAGVMSVFYWPSPSGDGANVWRQLVHKVKITNCTATGVVNGVIGFDGVNFGAVMDTDGVMQPGEDGWGVLKNVCVLRGSDQPGRTYPNGTTGAILSNCQNLLVDSCEFSNVYNQGNPDGCGFDFETNCGNMTIQNTRFFDNDGHSILMMNGGDFGPNTNIVIQKNIFAGNVKSTSQSTYEFSISTQYDGHAIHKNIKIRDNIVFMRKTNKDGKNIVLYVTNNRGHVTATDNDLYYLEPLADTITVSFLGELYSYNAQISSVAIPVISLITIEKNPVTQMVSIYTEVTKGSPTWYMASENSDFSGASWNTYNSTIDYTLSDGSEIKTVYFKVKNAAGESAPASVDFDLTTSIENIELSKLNFSNIKVFPNPVSSILNVSIEKTIYGTEGLTGKEDIYEVTLINFDGKILEQSLYNGNSFQLDLSRHPIGMFLIRIKHADNVYTKTIIKN